MHLKFCCWSVVSPVNCHPSFLGNVLYPTGSCSYQYQYYLLCVHVCVCVGYMSAEAIKHWMLFLRSQSTDSFGTGSLMAWNSPRRLGQLSSKPWGCPYLYFTSTRAIWVLGIKLGSSHLQGKHLPTELSEPPTWSCRPHGKAEGMVQRL